MKQKITVLLAIVVASAGLVTTAVNAESPATEITGVITENQVAVDGASVTSTCNGNVQTDTTDTYGSYRVLYSSADCPFGSTVKVSAQKGNKSGVASGTVQGITTKLNLAIVNVSIPEYGLIGGTLAAIASMGAIVYTRRRQEQTDF